MASFHVWAAIRTIKDKIGTWVGYEKYLEYDPNLGREEWARAIGQARASIANRIDESTRPLNRRPVAGEIKPISMKKGTGYLQHIEIFVRDRDTGLIEARYFAVRTQTLRSRQSIVNEGMEKYIKAASESPDDYPEEVIGAQYTGTHEIVRKA